MWEFFCHDYRLMMIAAVSILPMTIKSNEGKEKEKNGMDFLSCYLLQKR